MKSTTHPVLLIGHDLLILGLAAMLRARGQWVIVREGGREDVAALTTPQRPAAILIDLIAARRGDFALLRRLRAIEDFATVPILVLSPGTVEQGAADALVRQLVAFDARPMLQPHDLDAVLSELARSLASVA